MRLSRLSRLAFCTLALLLAVSAVNLTAPPVVRTVVESDSDAGDDENREIELAAPASARHTPSLDRPATRAVGFSRTLTAVAPSSRGAPSTSAADPLGARLRC